METTIGGTSFFTSMSMVRKGILDPTCDSWLVGFGCWFDVWPIGSMHGIFTYIWIIWLIFMVNVGKYTSPMDPMGYDAGTFNLTLKCFDWQKTPPLRFSAPPGGYRDGFQLCSSRAQIWGHQMTSVSLTSRRKLRNDWLEHPTMRELKYFLYWKWGRFSVRGCNCLINNKIYIQDLHTAVSRRFPQNDNTSSWLKKSGV